LKVYPNKLQAELKKNGLPLYIVSGDEPLLVQESCDLIRSTLKKSGYAERELYHVEAKFDWEQVAFSINSMSLFAEQKIIELRFNSTSPGNAGIAILTAFAEAPPSDTVMLLVMPKLDARSTRTKWFLALEKAAIYVQIWPIELKDMPAWIENRFRRAGLTATREAVSMMVERLEGNLLAAVQEIERLRLVSPDGKVDGVLVRQGVADHSRYDVFSLIDAAVGGDATRTLKIATGLQLEGVEVLYLVSMLAREIRALIGMAADLESGTLDSALRNGRVWQKRKHIVSECLRTHTRSDLLMLLASVSDIDGMVKGAVSGNPWDELTSIALALAGIGSLPHAAQQA